MVIAGQGRQSSEWIAANMQGRFVYPNGVEANRPSANGDPRGRHWVCPLVCSSAPFTSISPVVNDMIAPPVRRSSRAQRFIDHLHTLEDAGIDHLALLLRPSRRP